ncbi:MULTISPECIES: flagellar assembly peptidoglycan hydrolase FlgJ [unclassified Pseudomonas]|uniref:flagellar assembly peptidoglycan hydrolase FlgJ n=1 Tax=unclassified Pseudomonas TaxID=196821 RepID=UPI002449A417|nr:MULTISPECIES: flagellar assembly peptidoglycan hydrolase FlgJ [unclassified Pseudomonas]MDG9927165.1 flagellar assembly peptidoglycan hydrolase FlgJ [Pseudomonas sp. GD04042]MDH0482826.1 flagellar assembly peptidoglycan hydrolase FlgJ [Pseudomonas sp. GD04015]MDH0602580.1 flagellar assembly peptidoglycan hydrolase FlgJ [Pseudomonas sp. GD03869]MDH0893147.1 flagellar assembly peptidoglycan hydrolase FlgJ [Pseudomonas sp. GD03875]MDH1063032.1 flagellar assembly peptidoglycan hydrolase FlgJ [P
MDSRLAAGLDNGAYTDLNRLNQFKVGGDTEGNIKKVAQEFESLFLNEMMKSMRKANEVFGEDNFMNSNESKTYQDMHDQQLAVTLSKNNGGIGLASVLERQLSQMKSGPKRVNPFAQVESPNATARAGAFKPAGEGGAARDDSALLNQRRLSLPSKLTDRLLAGIVPATEAQPLAGSDWVPAQASAVADGKPLGLNDSAAVSGRSVAQPPLAKGKSAFASAAEFVQTMLPLAEEAAQKIGVDARYLVAQAALETGWGKSIIRQADGSSSHNLFGIKAHGGWQGESARVLTTEYKGGEAVKEAASFRAYDSYRQSFNDYVSFLQGNGRYQEALAVTDKPESFVRELQQAGYATDPQYARKISQIARQMQTYQAVAAADSPTTRT